MQNGQVQFFRSSDNEIELIFCKYSQITYSTHTHATSYALGFVLEGTLEIKRKGHAERCHAGDFFVVPPNIPHSICPANGVYSMLTVCLGIDSVYKYDMDIMLQSLQILMASLVTQGLITSQQITMLKDAVEVLYVSLLEVEIPKNKGVYKAKELLERMPENPYTTELLAEQVFISPYYLIRAFKEELGLTPHQFHMQRRIRKAQKLLLQSDTVAEVALATGFCDQSHFDKWFGRIVGITPSEYIQVQMRLS